MHQNYEIGLTLKYHLSFTFGLTIPMPQLFFWNLGNEEVKATKRIFLASMGLGIGK